MQERSRLTDRERIPEEGNQPGSPRLPNLILAGAPRCGSTALCNVLAAHPDIFMVPRKELWFFYTDSVWSRGLDWYRGCFRSHGGERFVGEGTPLYYACPDSITRMERVLPEAKILLILRDPIRRLLSHYHLYVRKFKESLSLEDAIARELRGEEPWKLERGARNYVGLGRYDTHIRRILDHFSASQVHILLLEELISNPGPRFDDLWRFLTVARGPVNELPRENRGRAFRSPEMGLLYKDSRLKRLVNSLVPKALVPGLRSIRDRFALGPAPSNIPPHLHRLLCAEYAEHIAGLERILGRPIPAWKAHFPEHVDG